MAVPTVTDTTASEHVAGSTTPIEWKIRYDDGDVFTNLDGRSRDAPKFGALAITQRSELTGHDVLYGEFLYHWRGKWWAANTMGMIDKVTHFVHQIEAVLHGRWIDDAQWNEILIAAKNDSDFPPRSAFRPRDRRALD